MSEQWLDTDVTAKSFVDDLKSFNGSDVTIHINSGGGCCFNALAIYNTIKQYSGAVNVSIEGLCASAATIIAMGGSKITIAANSLMMIHNPSVGLAGYFDESDIGKVANSLSAVKSTLIQTYQTRTGKSESELAKLLSAETWYTAQEAVENGFADEILGEVSSQFDASKQILFVNKMSVDCRKFDCAQLRNKLDSIAIERTNFMDEKSILSKIKNLLSGEAKIADALEDIKNFREKEQERIKNLHALKCENTAVNAIIDVAVYDGKSAEEIKLYVEAIKNAEPSTEKTAQAILNLIEDQMKSGAEGVAGSAEEISEADKRKEQAALIAKFANGQI